LTKVWLTPTEEGSGSSTVQELLYMYSNNRKLVANTI
jgi:hypothetical protein